MRYFHFICTLCVFMVFASQTSAQMVEFDDPIQLTFYTGGNTSEASAATNGTVWGVAYSRIDGSHSVHFLRCTTDGIHLGGQQIFNDPEEKKRYAIPTVTAYQYGWALTYQYFVYRGKDDYTYRHYFSTLDKFGRKTGAMAIVCEDIPGRFPAPIWMDQTFLIFYSGKTSTGYTGIHLAYFDRQAKRIKQDVVITKPLGRNHFVEEAVPTSEGIALFGRTYINHNLDTAFYILVDLEGKPLTDTIYLENNGDDFFAATAIWNGNDLLVAGIEQFVDYSKAVPFTRMLSTNGNWKSPQIRHTENNDNRHLGIASDGTRYLSIATNWLNGTTTARQVNSNMQQVGTSFMVDDSDRTDIFSLIESNGSEAALFLCSAKAGTLANTWNVYFQRYKFPHSGKPEVKYFKGKIHKFNGKQYVLFNWLVAGANEIKLKTKGGRWTLPATGFHAVEITNKSKYKIVASNSAGSAKAKLKITP